MNDAREPIEDFRPDSNPIGVWNPAWDKALIRLYRSQFREPVAREGETIMVEFAEDARLWNRTTWLPVTSVTFEGRLWIANSYAHDRPDLLDLAIQYQRDPASFKIETRLRYRGMKHSREGWTVMLDVFVRGLVTTDFTVLFRLDDQNQYALFLEDFRGWYSGMGVTFWMIDSDQGRVSNDAVIPLRFSEKAQRQFRDDLTVANWGKQP